MLTQEHIEDYITRKGQSGIAGYPLALIVDCEYVCPSCAQEKPLNDREREQSHITIYYEGAALYCADCNQELESAYGDCNAVWDASDIAD
jgi:hypothetical protein